MPDADLPDTPFRPTRRAMLGAAGTAVTAGVLGGCTGDRPALPRRRRSAPDPDVVVATEALGLLVATQRLVQATVTRHGALSRPLTDLLDARAAHVATLEDAVPADSVGTTPGPSGGPSPSPTGPADTPQGGPTPATRVPREPARALDQVVQAERELSLGVKRLAFRAHSGPFARLLAAIAASSAQHATVLDATARGRRP